MPDSFIYANGRISGKENTLLDERMWQMLISAQNEEEVLRFLGDTWYGGFMQHHSLEGCFINAMEVTEEELVELSEDDRLTRGLLHRRDVRNARYIWKNQLTVQRTPGEIEIERPGLIPVDILEKAVHNASAREELPGLFRETLEELLETEGISGPDLDRSMDNLAAEVEYEELPRISSGFRTFVMTGLEQKNFLTAGRCKLAGSSKQNVQELLLLGGYHSGEEIAEAYQRNTLPMLIAETPGFDEPARAFAEALDSGSFFAFEKECDRQLLELLEKGAFPVFGPSPLAAFVIRREMEIKHLKLLVAAKIAGVDSSRLQKRLPRG
ncbi:MAG: V-type ATPase subunit [Candidatus Aegiribacteria sp.]|nr:V-type ATPase subunit [Candidatus Aegiribacteria sp.]